MRKIFINRMAILMTVVMSVVFASCGSDSTSDSEPVIPDPITLDKLLVGTWRSNTDDGYRTLTFNQDGTGLNYEYWEYDNESSSEKFTWKTNKDALTLTYNDEDNSVITCTYFVKSDKLTINWGQESETYVKSSGQNVNQDTDSDPNPDVDSSGSEQGYEYVNLGLPSGTKWATMNIGANKFSDYGNYYAWGETNTKSTYNWDNYIYYGGTSNHITYKVTKYCTDSKYGSVDNKKELVYSDDTATKEWGTKWQIPSISQWIELMDYCSWEWVKQNDVLGIMVVSRINEKKLFLPAAGIYENTSLKELGSRGVYQSRTLEASNNAYSQVAVFHSENWFDGVTERYRGTVIRPVVK